MKHASLNIAITGLFAVAVTAFGFDGYPQADKLEPRAAKVGTVLTITGTALSKDKVEEVYLTDHRFDMKVKVLEQTEGTLKIRIPPFAKPGRLQLLFLTGGDKPAYLEQPLYVQVEEGDLEPAAPVEVTKKAAKTVEVASIGTNIPVPPASASEVPVKREETRATMTAAAPVPVSPAPKAEVRQPVPQPQAPTPPQQQQQQTQAAPVPADPQQQPVAQQRTITPPRLIKRSPVTMPSSSASLGSDTNVELLLRIRTDGRVGNIKVVRGNPMFVQAATRSVRDWVYESAYVGSTPVETDVTVILNFKR
jgi:outer membrane biosynthesis protein TonB